MRPVGNCVNKAPIVLLVLEMHEDDDEEENEDEDSPSGSLTMPAIPLV